MVNVEREPVNLKHGIKEDPTNFKVFDENPKRQSN